jgi:rare lipoprotein A
MIRHILAFKGRDCPAVRNHEGMRMMRLTTTLAVAGMFVGAALAATSSEATAKSRQDTNAATRTALAVQRGPASWYGPGFHGRRTASGEQFNAGAMTAAHRTLPFGTRVRVKHAKSGRSVVVRINDRGPYALGRIIDLSRASAQMLGIAGVATVTLAKL